ncbi:MAG: tRNA lysidine(34) synthetase TilS [Lachnospiraceae bacterium]|nr:tRNA lysidine(34) synthetase TilS [Lachnospiraceae bacterium]
MITDWVSVTRIGVGMWKKITDYIGQYDMLQAGDRVTAGVSGGADSVCLLRLLCDLRERIGFELYVVHVNHGLRGAEADEDEAFTRRLCKAHEVPFRAVRADVAELARREGIGEEEAGRRIRYEAFLEECRERGCNKAAVAHNREDNAETVLFRLFRGSFAGGLSGIRPIRELAPGIQLIRPLLNTPRAEIERILKELKQDYRTDRTNLTTDYGRNVIRHQILSVASERLNSEAAANVVRAAEQLGEVYEVFSEHVDEAEQRYLSMPEKARMDAGEVFLSEELLSVKKVIACEVIMRAFGYLRGSKKDLGTVHVEAVYGLFSLQCGRKLTLPAGMTALRTYGGILLQSREEEAAALPGEISVPGRWYLPELGCWLNAETAKYEKNIIIPKNNCTKWFDYDKIKGTLNLRTRKEGDFLQIRQDGGTKSLKSLLIDEKIPVERRGRLPLLAVDSHILWVIGGRASEAFRIGEDTRTILKVNLYGGNGYGGEN